MKCGCPQSQSIAALLKIKQTQFIQKHMHWPFRVKAEKIGTALEKLDSLSPLFLRQMKVELTLRYVQLNSF